MNSEIQYELHLLIALPAELLILLTPQNGKEFHWEFEIIEDKKIEGQHLSLRLSC